MTSIEKQNKFNSFKETKRYLAASQSSKVIALKTQALELLEDVLFSLGKPQASRFIQDLPIRLNVWRKFAENPTQNIKLILTPNYLVTANQALIQIKKEVFQRDSTGQLLALPNSILISANIDRTFFSLLRQTYWWQKHHSQTMNQWNVLLNQKNTPRTLSKTIDDIFQLEGPEIVRLIAVWSIILSAEEKCLSEFSESVTPEQLEICLLYTSPSPRDRG